MLSPFPALSVLEDVGQLVLGHRDGGGDEGAHLFCSTDGVMLNLAVCVNLCLHGPAVPCSSILGFECAFLGTVCTLECIGLKQVKVNMGPCVYRDLSAQSQWNMTTWPLMAPTWCLVSSC